MKKHLAFLIVIAIILNMCTWTGCGNDTSSGRGASNAETAPEQETADGSGASPAQSAKPSLMITEEEDGDYYRAAQVRKTASEDTGASVITPITAGETADHSGKVSEAGQNTASGSSKVPETGQNTADEKEYTVMVYVVGSNLESRNGAATNDLIEMTNAGLDHDKTNLVVYAGGCKRWVSNIPNTNNSVLDMRGDGSGKVAFSSTGDGFLITAQTQEVADMGSPGTLSAFINYCTDNYPAKHYGLILWDHGGGPLWGYGSDELFGNDSLILQELRSAMDQTIFGSAAPSSGRKLDWVGFDACLMGNIESANLWKDYADYMVGSEELEPGRGWDYSFLSVLNRTSDAKEIVSEIVDAYGTYYEANRSRVFNPDVTLAAMDLSKTEKLVSSANSLFEAMREGIGSDRYAPINQARARSKAFGLSASPSKEGAYDLIDLRDFAQNVSELYPEQSRDVIAALDEMIVRSASNVENTGGVSIYLPGDNAELYDVAQELYTEESALSDSYRNYVDAYTTSWFSSANADWELASMQDEGDELTLQLTQEQAENMSEAFYTFLIRNSAGNYLKILCDVGTVPDENNVLHVPKDQLLIYAVSDLSKSHSPWGFRQIEGGSGGEHAYKTLNIVLTPGDELLGMEMGLYNRSAISLKVKDTEQETEILDITDDSGSAWISGKGSIDISDYKSIIDISRFTYSPVRDENGTMLPYDQWQFIGVDWPTLPIDSSFRFEAKPASSFPYNFVCQITVKDINSKIHASEIADVNYESADHENGEMETENGVLYFDVFDDYAEVVDYVGTDEKIVIPEYYESVPVKKIGEGAFMQNEGIRSVSLPGTVEEIDDYAFASDYHIEEINLPENLRRIGIEAFQWTDLVKIQIPDGVKEIGRGAFLGSKLESVELPASLEQIGDIPFGGCKELKEISVRGDGANYKTVDNVLYTADGKNLIQFPAGREGSYTVEPGTEVIQYGAFSKAKISEVVFPDSLAVIENAAFYNCSALNAPKLPDALTYIGDAAFGIESVEYQFSKDDYPKETAENYRIGPNVSHIGRDVFKNSEIASFEVDEGNEYFASSGGFITNTSKDSIIMRPSKMKEYVVIPDGITTLQSGLFTELDPDTEFNIPDSTYRFSRNVFPGESDVSAATGENEMTYSLLIHCSEGSAAQEYAEEFGMRVDHNTDPEDQYFDVVTQDTESGTLTWRVYKSRAELWGIILPEESSNVELEVPSAFKGLPVTAIRDGGILINSGIGLSSLVIPETVEEIDARITAYHPNLSRIEVSSENPMYTAVDNVLLTKDGSKLVWYPRGSRQTQYTIPDDVEEIADEAFAYNDFIEEIRLSGSMRVIGKRAFRDCKKLKTVVFNRGLKEIRDGAFSGLELENVSLPSTLEWIGKTAFTLHENYGELILPDKLRRMGWGAFSGGYGEGFHQEVIRIPAKLEEFKSNNLDNVIFMRFEVDPKNDDLDEIDGLLVSEDHKTLIAAPRGIEGELVIPDGILYVNDYLSDCEGITDIYLPDSLLYINAASMNLKGIKLHCHEGTEIQKHLAAQGIEWVKIE